MATEKPNQKKPIVPEKPITPMDELMNDLIADSKAVERQWQITKAQLSQSREATEALEEQAAILRGQARAFESSLNKIKALKTGTPPESEQPKPSEPPKPPKEVKKE